MIEQLILIAPNKNRFRYILLKHMTGSHLRAIYLIIKCYFGLHYSLKVYNIKHGYSNECAVCRKILK